MSDFEETIVTIERIKKSKYPGKNETFYEIETDIMRTVWIPESKLSPEIEQVKEGDRLKYMTHRTLCYLVAEIHDMKGNILYSEYPVTPHSTSRP